MTIKFGSPITFDNDNQDSGLLFGYSMNLQPNIWNGVFDTWEEEPNAAALGSEETLQAFDTSRWMDRQDFMLSSARKGISPRFTNLQLLVSATNSRSVIDLGGGSGWTFELICQSNSLALDRYTVVEQKTSVDAFSLSFITDERVEFVTSEHIADLQLDSADMLYSNGALQYFPDIGLLSQLAFTNSPNWILLDDSQTVVGRDFFSLQHCYGAEIPCRFGDINSVITEVQNLGYTLKGNWEYLAFISGSMQPTVDGRQNTNNDRATPRCLLFEAV